VNALESVVLEATDPEAAEKFYAAAFGLGEAVDVREATDVPTSGFRSFTLSLVVSQPSTVDSLVRTALEAGATAIKPVAKSFWGYGGTVQAPDGAIWKVATSSKKDTGPATRDIDDIALLLGVADVKETKKFYVEHGLEVAKSFGSKYVEFASSGPVTLALYGHKALAKDAGVDPQGSGAHRIAIRGGLGSFTDPDGFAWEAASS
jgi:predicted lactoylglutathione lyase